MNPPVIKVTPVIAEALADIDAERYLVGVNA